jgi:hypothetical protein
MACAACHKVARERDFVFSLLPPPFSKETPKIADWKNKKAMVFDDFKTVERSDVPSVLAEKTSDKNFRRLEGPVAKNVFAGTLNEIAPLLAKEVLRTNLPAFLSDIDQKYLAIVMKNPKGTCEQKGAQPLIFWRSTTATEPNGKPSLMSTEFCQNEMETAHGSILNNSSQ